MVVGWSVFVVYTQVENHFLNPGVMSRTVRINPLMVLVSVLVAGAIGNWLGGTFGAVVAALLAIPISASLQIAVREIRNAIPAEQALPAEAQGDAPPGSS